MLDLVRLVRSWARCKHAFVESTPLPGSALRQSMERGSAVGRYAGICFPVVSIHVLSCAIPVSVERVRFPWWLLATVERNNGIFRVTSVMRFWSRLTTGRLNHWSHLTIWKSGSRGRSTAKRYVVGRWTAVTTHAGNHVTRRTRSQPIARILQTLSPHVLVERHP